MYGLRPPEIATKHRLTDKAIEYHFTNIFKLLNINDAAQLYYGYRRYLGSTVFESLGYSWQPPNLRTAPTVSRPPIPEKIPPKPEFQTVHPYSKEEIQEKILGMTPIGSPEYKGPLSSML
jgi:hypothetical protein